MIQKIVLFAFFLTIISSEDVPIDDYKEYSSINLHFAHDSHWWQFVKDSVVDSTFKSYKITLENLFADMFSISDVLSTESEVYHDLIKFNYYYTYKYGFQFHVKRHANAFVYLLASYGRDLVVFNKYEQDAKNIILVSLKKMQISLERVYNEYHDTLKKDITQLENCKDSREFSEKIKTMAETSLDCVNSRILYVKDEKKKLPELTLEYFNIERFILFDKMMKILKKIGKYIQKNHSLIQTINE
ncbi:uncharacterized protein LOC126895348 isoform X3 [Daktulosphaira vitifoliae]|uniref:uncharacterized protein LOC126895348 isoform X3 n=1 Tax=Daktulosphaira vitifoliae TaxID=58002 RepID=UPI0021AA41D5|nr:uncharacterized protein LOC126895348 isoform X3 [Daktulosphaira vitifoliae]